MQCSTNRSCCTDLFLILAGFICAVELVFGSLLAVCVVCLFCNVGLCCKCCFYLLSFTIVVFCVSSIFVTSFKEFIIQFFFFWGNFFL